MKKSCLVLLAFALFSGGCSMVSLMYRNADWLLLHKIDAYTSFDDRQQLTIREDIADYMRWHRKYALPEYIKFLHNLNGTAQLKGRLDSGAVAQLRGQLQELYRSTLAPAVRPAAQILASLDDSQIAELARNLAEENRQQRHELLDVVREEYLEKRADHTIDFLEGLAGDLSAAQQQQVRAASRGLPGVDEQFFQHRVSNQATLIALLKERAGADRVANFLASWINTPEATRTVLQQHAIESFQDDLDEMIVDIHSLLTAAQKDHLRKKLTSYIDEMNKLASDTNATANNTPQPSTLEIIP